MPIQTATPEQVEQCVLGLKRTVDRQAATIERQAAEIERLRGALGWYVGRSAESLMFDGGRRAAEALSEARP